MESFETARRGLKSDRWEEWRQLDTAQKRGEAMPPLQKSYPDDAALIDLIAPEDLTVGNMPLREVIWRRRWAGSNSGGERCPSRQATT